MKIATLDDGSRDGQLVVVSRDLASAHFATGIAGRAQALLDDWNFISPQLEDLYATLNGGKARHAFPFDPARCRAPLARAHDVAWVGGWPAAGEPLPPPAVRLSGAGLLGPAERQPDAAPPRAWPALVAVTGDLPAGSPAAAAGEALRLVGLALLLDTAPGAPVVTDGEPASAAEGVQPAADEPFDRFAAVRFAPVLATPDEVLVAPPVLADGRGRARRRLPLPDAASVLAAALARRVRRQPLRAGALLLVGPAGGVAGEGRLDLLDGHGHSLVGAVAVAPEDDAPA